MRFTILLAIVVGYFVLGCSSMKNSINKPLPNSLEISSAIKEYKLLKRDKNIQTYAPTEAFSAGKIYSLLESQKDLKKANHLAHLLKSQIKLAKLTTKEKLLSDKLLELEKRIVRKELEEKDQELNSIKIEQEKLIKRDEGIDNLNATITPKGVKFIIGDNFFEKGSSKLLITSIRVIDKIVDFLKSHPDKIVLIESYSDNSGSTSYNLDFSLRRANSVAKMLKAQGVDKNRIKIEAKGEQNPIVPNDRIENRSANRRVEIYVVD